MEEAKEDEDDEETLETLKTSSSSSTVDATAIGTGLAPWFSAAWQLCRAVSASKRTVRGLGMLPSMVVAA